MRAPMLQVFLSSTTHDLPTHRAACLDAIGRVQNCHVLAIEHATASGDDVSSFALQLVDRADIYIGIFGHRYGYVPADPQRNPQGLSVTELEYHRAVERGIPCLIFLMHEAHPVLSRDIERDPIQARKLDAMKAELVTKRICGFFKSPEDLKTLLIQALNNEVEVRIRVRPEA
jgi:hypothetical protein